MKNLVQKQKMRVAGLCLAIGMSAVAVNAQTVGDVAKNKAKTNDATATPSTASVRVVDNKGTIKYLQANNGLTQIVNTTGDLTTTTWQLGGTLTDNTFIDANGNVFGLDKIELVGNTLSASTDATDKSVHGTGTGFTLLVRDEGTGAVKKLLVSDLVKGGLATPAVTTAATSVTYTDASIPADINKISVYRNGIKLLVTDNYTLTGSAGAYVVTVLGTVGTPAAGGAPESDDYYALATSDKLEIQWVK